MTPSPSMLPVSGEQHEKAREAAMHAAARVGWGASTTDATLAAYFASLAAQGVRLVDVREVAEWLPCEVCGAGPQGRCALPDHLDCDSCPHGCYPER